MGSEVAENDEFFSDSEAPLDKTTSDNTKLNENVGAKVASSPGNEEYQESAKSSPTKTENSPKFPNMTSSLRGKKRPQGVTLGHATLTRMAMKRESFGKTSKNRLRDNL